MGSGPRILRARVADLSRDVGHRIFCGSLERKKGRVERACWWVCDLFNASFGQPQRKEFYRGLPAAFAGGHLLVGRGVDIECANHWFGLEAGRPDHFVHVLVLHAVILLGILLGVPEAESRTRLSSFV